MCVYVCVCVCVCACVRARVCVCEAHEKNDTTKSTIFFATPIVVNS